MRERDCACDRPHIARLTLTRLHCTATFFVSDLKAAMVELKTRFLLQDSSARSITIAENILKSGMMEYPQVRSCSCVCGSACVRLIVCLFAHLCYAL